VASGDVEFVWPPGELLPSSVGEDVPVGDATGEVLPVDVADAPGEGDGDGDTLGIGEGLGDGEGLGLDLAATPIFAGLLVPIDLML
jgi:hypothetical protein